MDLSQAEAVIDIINAKTDLSLEIAESQREGRLSKTIREIRASLLEILAEMAVKIDYPEADEDDDDGGSNSELAHKLRWVHADVENLLDTVSIGRIAREGVRVVIAGKPNAGKSSLMNALLGEGRVLVTETPVTMRDTVEETTSLGGIPIVLVDTTGLHETDDKDAKLGIERALQAIAGADIVILVIDGSKDLDEDDDKVLGYIERTDTENVLVVVNKLDLGDTVSDDEIEDKLPDATIIRTSLIRKGAKQAAREISEAIVDIFDLDSIDVKETSIVTNERHVQMLRNADMNLDEAIDMLSNGEPMEAAELSARYAYESLGKIIGEGVGDEVLNTVFSRFCMGK